MIVTVTPNPSVDRTITVGRLRHGEVNRAEATRTDPGGKGVNVSRAVAAHGGDTLAVLPVGGASGRTLTDLLVDAGVSVRAVPISGALRENVAVAEPDGTTTKINEPGPHLTGAEVTALLAAVRAAAGTTPGSWIVGSGSLPGGVAEDFYADLVRLGHDTGARVAIDTSGAPLPAAVGAAPDLVKPNRAELGELVGADLGTVGDVVDAARDLVSGGVGRVLVSLGRDGALLVTEDRAVRAVAAVARPVSTVGAGDCALAGFLLAHGHGADPTRALERAVAFGTAAVAVPGTGVPSRHDVGAVRVRLDPEPCRTDRLTD